jgi:2-polyprenyl-6-methoxyphenol hydroxylase-like FAD-dependent oxidoreductase
MDEKQCVIAGGGPAGVMLGLLLAKAGVTVLVLEKHGDFLRDFRGDTVHPSTLEVLDELGLAARFAALDARRSTTFTLSTDTGDAVVGDFTLLRERHPYLAFVPQWDLLNLLTEEASRHPNFELRMNSEATGLLREGGTVTGVRYRDEKGEEHEVRARLTVGADGRGSRLRDAAALPMRDYGAPMDVAWFRLSRENTDPAEPFLRMSPGRLLVAINRETYWQLGYIVPKGQTVEDIPNLRQEVAALLPFLAERVPELEEVSVLSVQVNRARRWYRPGLLLIGDAAHAMSPVMGVGINLAIQDAVAAANLLYEPLLRGTLNPGHLAAVQRRRTPPTVAIQALQLLVQRGLIAPALSGRDARSSPPKPLVLLRGFPPAQRFLTHLIAHGVRPEHVRIPD